MGRSRLLRWPRPGPVRSLRVRTTILSVAIVGAALVVGGALLVVLLRNTLTDQLRTTARLRAMDVAGVLESGTPPEALAVNDEDELLIQVVDPSGSVVASSANVKGEAPVADLAPGGWREVSDVPIQDEQPFIVVAVEARAPGGSFVVLVGRSTERVAETTGVVATSLGAGLPVLLILVGVLSWRVVARTLAPVDAIRQEVEEISAVELHRRVPDDAADREIADLGSTMNRMLDRLEQAQDRQRRFVSDASHELRSPVASIRQHAEVALAHPDGTTAQELAEVVLAEDLRVQRLVEDLLLLARADERTLPMSRRPVDLDDLVFAEAERLRGAGRVRVDVSRVGAGRVHGDPAHLRRLLRNLADNAVRHAASVVRFSVVDDGTTVTMTVEDDGGGIPPSQRARIFERFVRLDEARTRDDGGSGLGLAIVAEIASAHGATVTVESSDLGGARFVVRVPAGPT